MGLGTGSPPPFLFPSAESPFFVVREPNARLIGCTRLWPFLSTPDFSPLSLSNLNVLSAHLRSVLSLPYSPSLPPLSNPPPFFPFTPSLARLRTSQHTGFGLPAIFSCFVIYQIPATYEGNILTFLLAPSVLN